MTKKRLAVIVGVAACAATGVGLASASWWRSETFAKRPDIVASVSSTSTAIVTASYDEDVDEDGDGEIDGNAEILETITVPLTGGKVVLSTNDAACRPGVTSATCRYHLLELVLDVIPAQPFTLADTEVRYLRVALAGPLMNLVDDGGEITIPDGTRFLASGFVDWEDEDTRTSLIVSPTSNDALALRVNLTTQVISLMGNLQGQSPNGGLGLSMDIAMSTGPGFTNLPPVARAGADQAAETNCYAEVPLNPSQTADPDGNLRHYFYRTAGTRVGRGVGSTRFFPGSYNLTLEAEDRVGAVDTDTVSVEVVDNGEPFVPPGASLVSFEIPSALETDSAALIATEKIDLADRVTVRGQSGAGTEVINMGSASQRLTNLGSQTKVVGNVRSRPKLWMRDHSEITGSLHSSQAPDTQNIWEIGGSEVYGTGYFADAETVAWPVVAPGTRAAAIDLQPNQSLPLSPGDFNAITVKSQATLTLGQGMYRIRELRVEPQGKLVLSGAGATVLFLDDGITFRGTIEAPGGASLVLVSLGSQESLLTSPFKGTYIGPQSKLTLNSTSQTLHRGTFVARHIQVDSDAVIEHVPFSTKFLEEARSSCALVPEVRCVSETLSGFTARFGFVNQVDYWGTDVPAGPLNRVSTSGPDDQGQTTSFLSGYQNTAEARTFEVPFAASGQVSWMLGARKATASAASPRCVD